MKHFRNAPTIISLVVIKKKLQLHFKLKWNVNLVIDHLAFIIMRIFG
jgi:hypothetical protein